MFGHQDDQHDQQHDDSQAAGSSNEVAAPQAGQDVWQAPVPTTPQDASNPAYNPSVGAPVGSPAPSEPSPAAAPATTAVPGDYNGDGLTDTNDLLDIKQHALTELSPLVGHLDQTPEEKFRTTMMMIQASDNQALVKEAYEAAQSISDEKARAQALLDVINEINYFTQNHAS